MILGVVTMHHATHVHFMRSMLLTIKRSHGWYAHRRISHMTHHRWSHESRMHIGTVRHSSRWHVVRVANMAGSSGHVIASQIGRGGCGALSGTLSLPNFMRYSDCILCTFGILHFSPFVNEALRTSTVFTVDTLTAWTAEIAGMKTLWQQIRL